MTSSKGVFITDEVCSSFPQSLGGYDEQSWAELSMQGYYKCQLAFLPFQITAKNSCNCTFHLHSIFKTIYTAIFLQRATPQRLGERKREMQYFSGDNIQKLQFSQTLHDLQVIMVQPLFDIANSRILLKIYQLTSQSYSNNVVALSFKIVLYSRIILNSTNMIGLMKPISKKGQQGSNSTKFPEQCKTEVEIKLKNLSKLLFVDSDDQKPQQQQPKGRLRQTSYTSRKRQSEHDLDLHKRRPFSKQFKADSKMLKPSLMRGLADNQQDYEQVINCQTFRPAMTTSCISNRPNNMVAAQQSTIFEKLVQKRDMVRAQRIHRKRAPKKFYEEEQSVVKQAKQVDMSNQSSQTQQKVTKKQEQQVIIPKLQIANVCFQLSDQQPEDTQNSRKSIEQDMTTSKQLEQPPATAPTRAEQQKEQPTQQEKFNAFEQKRQLEEAVNITQIVDNPEVYQRSKYLIETIKGQTLDEGNMIGLMHTPLLLGTKQTFEVQVISNLTEKYYLFWLERGQQKKLLMKAIKLLTLNRTTFEFQAMHPSLLQYLETCSMTSNIDRSVFNMYRIDRKRNKKRLLATYSQTLNIKSNKLIIVYYPKIEQNTESAIFQDVQIKKDLQTLYRQHHSQYIDFAMTAKLDIGKKLKLMNHFNLKASQKSMEFKNSNGSLQVIIGKKESKRYKIIVGPGLSPAQIFGLTIVQIQT